DRGRAAGRLCVLRAQLYGSTRGGGRPRRGDGLRRARTRNGGARKPVWMPVPPGEKRKSGAGDAEKLCKTDGGGDVRVIPAIDLKGGQCVRLQKGDYNTVHKVAEDAVETARRFQSAGATLIHMVDLDAAKD